MEQCSSSSSSSSSPSHIGSRRSSSNSGSRGGRSNDDTSRHKSAEVISMVCFLNDRVGPQHSATGKLLDREHIASTSRGCGLMHTAKKTKV